MCLFVWTQVVNKLLLIIIMTVTFLKRRRNPFVLLYHQSNSYIASGENMDVFINSTSWFVKVTTWIRNQVICVSIPLALWTFPLNQWLCTIFSSCCARTRCLGVPICVPIVNSDMLSCVQYYTISDRVMAKLINSRQYHIMTSGCTQKLPDHHLIVSK